MQTIILINILGFILAAAAIGYIIYLIATKKILRLFKFEPKVVDVKPTEDWLRIEDTTEEVVYLCEDGTEYHYKKFRE